VGALRVYVRVFALEIATPVAMVKIVTPRAAFSDAPYYPGWPEILARATLELLIAAAALAAASRVPPRGAMSWLVAVLLVIGVLRYGRPMLATVARYSMPVALMTVIPGLLIGVVPLCVALWLWYRARTSFHRPGHAGAES